MSTQKKIKLTASKIETAKAYKHLEAIIDSPEDFKELLKHLVSPHEKSEIDRAIKGLSQEDEFALMCYLMGTATHLVQLDQKPLIKGNFSAPDFLARFQPGCWLDDLGKESSKGFNCLIEVKSTDKDIFKFSGKELKRKRNFADTFGLPLLFAVRFMKFEQNSFWVIVEDTDRTSQSIKITYNSMITGLRPVVWNEYFYYIIPGTYFKAVYDKNFNGTGVLHKKHGIQKEFYAFTPYNNNIISFTNQDAFLFSAFFEIFNLKEHEINHKDSLTSQILVPTINVCSISDALYKCNHLVHDEKGFLIYNAPKIIAHSDMETKHFLTRDILDNITASLFREKILFIAGFGNQEDHHNKWIHCGGQMPQSQNF